MSDVKTSEIKNVSWDGTSLSTKMQNKKSALKNDCRNLATAINQLKSFDGKRATEINFKTIPLTEQEKGTYGENATKTREYYRVWSIKGADNKYLTCPSEITSEISKLD